MSPPKKTFARKIGLIDLPHFQIAAITLAKNNWVELTGDFDHLEGVRNESQLGFLYVSRKYSIYGELKTVDRKTRKATFLGLATRKRLRPGLALPYVDRYFDPAQVARALEPASFWKRVKFSAQDMVRYKDPRVPGWWKSHTVDRKIALGAAEIHYVKGGWDHEHCDLCREKIGTGGSPYGYFKKTENVWLCENCYQRFIKRHDLRFLLL